MGRTPRDRVSVWANESPADRDLAGAERRQRGDHLGVTTRAIGKLGDLGPDAGRVDQLDRDRVEPDGLVEAERHLRRRRIERRSFGRVARHQRVVRRRRGREPEGTQRHDGDDQQEVAGFRHGTSGAIGSDGRRADRSSHDDNLNYKV